MILDTVALSMAGSFLAWIIWIRPAVTSHDPTDVRDGARDRDRGGIRCGAGRVRAGGLGLEHQPRVGIGWYGCGRVPGRRLPLRTGACRRHLEPRRPDRLRVSGVRPLVRCGRFDAVDGAGRLCRAGPSSSWPGAVDHVGGGDAGGADCVARGGDVRPAHDRGGERHSVGGARRVDVGSSVVVGQGVLASRGPRTSGPRRLARLGGGDRGQGGGRRSGHGAAGDAAGGGAMRRASGRPGRLAQSPNHAVAVRRGCRCDYGRGWYGRVGYRRAERSRDAGPLDRSAPRRWVGRPCGDLQRGDGGVGRTLDHLGGVGRPGGVGVGPHSAC